MFGSKRDIRDSKTSQAVCHQVNATGQDCELLGMCCIHPDTPAFINRVHQTSLHRSLTLLFKRNLIMKLLQVSTQPKKSPVTMSWAYVGCYRFPCCCVLIHVKESVQVVNMDSSFCLFFLYDDAMQESFAHRYTSSLIFAYHMGGRSLRTACPFSSLTVLFTFIHKVDN